LPHRGAVVRQELWRHRDSFFHHKQMRQERCTSALVIVVENDLLVIADAAAQIVADPGREAHLLRLGFVGARPCHT
jgi:hypothetical protein